MFIEFSQQKDFANLFSDYFANKVDHLRKNIAHSSGGSMLLQIIVNSTMWRLYWNGHHTGLHHFLVQKQP